MVSNSPKLGSDPERLSVNSHKGSCRIIYHTRRAEGGSSYRFTTTKISAGEKIKKRMKRENRQLSVTG